jgi:hypothetical protein
MEGVEGPVVETLKEEQEPEDCCDTKGRSKEPTGLTQRIHQEHADEYSDGTRESNGIVWDGYLPDEQSQTDEA